MTGPWMVIIVLGIAAALLLAGFGAVKLIRHWSRQRRRVRMEDALKAIHRAHRAHRPATLNTLIGSLGLSQSQALRLVEHMQQVHLIRCERGSIHLTDTGRQVAVRLVRGHRLWERLLADDAGVPLLNLHAAAERAEHRLNEQQLDALTEHLGHPATDPHGDPIPNAEGHFAPQDRRVLTDWPVDQPAEVVHVEDEPPAAMRKIAAVGLRPGSRLTVTRRDAKGIRIKTAEDRRGHLSPIVAGNVHVRPVAELHAETEPAVRLCDLSAGQKAAVLSVSDDCRGLTRRRLLDLGLTRGAQVQVELSDAVGSARAYRVRQTLIANLAPEDMRARYIAFFQTGWGVAAALGPLAAGIVIDTYSPILVWYAAGILCSTVALGYYVLKMRIGHRFKPIAHYANENMA